MESYIVRIYRRGESAEKLVGMVEEVGGTGQRAFRNFHELWDILVSETRNVSLKNTRKLHYGKD
ncbi:MAG: hypothetical protein ACMUJM_15480 [bacterium]